MKFKILLRKLSTDEYAHELCYEAFNNNFNSSLYMTYWLFIIYSKADVYLISSNKLEDLISIPNSPQLIMDELKHHNILKIIERRNYEFIKRN